jgi:hypothetical protein
MQTLYVLARQGFEEVDDLIFFVDRVSALNALVRHAVQDCDRFAYIYTYSLGPDEVRLRQDTYIEMACAGRELLALVEAFGGPRAVMLRPELLYPHVAENAVDE